MRAARILYQMVRADFLERVRRYSFLVTLAAALYLAYGVATEKVWIVVGNGYRGVYNSAWIGMLMSICCSTFLSLAGFYIVKNSVQRDSDTRVGLILAATPMRKDFYTLAKTVSNFAVLACMVGVLMLAAVAMQRLQTSAGTFSLWNLWAPFLWFALPSMLLTASVAVLFETVPGLRGGPGNIVYFFAWTASLAMGVNGIDDPMGMQLLYRSTRDAVKAVDPGSAKNFQFSLTIGGERAVRTFQWDGIEWSGRVLLVRVAWVAVAVGIAVLASLFFHRFDPARVWRKERRLKAMVSADSKEAPQTRVPMDVRLSPLAASRGSRFLPLVRAELRLMLKGRKWWWYAVSGGLLVGQFVAPDGNARSWFLIFAWIWPALVWSQMGCREERHGTSALLYSCEHSLTRQLPALWSAGVVLALASGCGVGTRLLFAAEWNSFAAWIAGACFVPSLALALGTWTGSSKMFEAIYTIWWYMGPAHRIPGIDFMGTTAASSQPGIYMLGTVILVASAYLRRRQLLGYA